MLLQSAPTWCSCEAGSAREQNLHGHKTVAGPPTRSRCKSWHCYAILQYEVAAACDPCDITAWLHTKYQCKTSYKTPPQKYSETSSKVTFRVTTQKYLLAWVLDWTNRRHYMKDQQNQSWKRGSCSEHSIKWKELQCNSSWLPSAAILPLWFPYWGRRLQHYHPREMITGWYLQNWGIKMKGNE